jgi:hypothetical protein
MCPGAGLQAPAPLPARLPRGENKENKKPKGKTKRTHLNAIKMRPLCFPPLFSLIQKHALEVKEIDYHGA